MNRLKKKYETSLNKGKEKEVRRQQLIEIENVNQPLPQKTSKKEFCLEALHEIYQLLEVQGDSVTPQSRASKRSELKSRLEMMKANKT